MTIRYGFLKSVQCGKLDQVVSQKSSISYLQVHQKIALVCSVERSFIGYQAPTVGKSKTHLSHFHRETTKECFLSISVAQWNVLVVSFILTSKPLILLKPSNGDRCAKVTRFCRHTVCSVERNFVNYQAPSKTWRNLVVMDILHFYLTTNEHVSTLLNHSALFGAADLVWNFHPDPHDG